MELSKSMRDGISQLKSIKHARNQGLSNGTNSIAKSMSPEDQIQ